MGAVAIHIHASAAEAHVAYKYLIVYARFRQQPVGMLKKHPVRITVVGRRYDRHNRGSIAPGILRA